MKELQVRLYDTTTETSMNHDIFIGNLYISVADEDADRILECHDSNAEIFMDSVYESFMSEVEEMAGRRFKKYFEENPCDVRIAIAKRI